MQHLATQSDIQRPAAASDPRSADVAPTAEPLSTTDPLAAAVELRNRGVSFVLATVVRAVAPTSAKPGDKAVLSEEGLLAGWVGGSCAEPIVRQEARAALRDGECRLLHITPDAEGPADRPGLSVHKMECYSGGALEIYLEPYLPMPTLLVFGNAPVARALCDLGRAMHYRVLVVDLGHRPSMGSDLEVVRDLDRLGDLDPSSTFAVVASHGTFDEESLEKLATLDVAYAGFVASRKRRDEVFAALSSRGVPSERLAHVRAPAGLDLGARLPHEVAVSVMAEIVSVRRSARSISPRAAAPSVASAPGNPRAAPPSPGRLSVASCCHGESHKPE